MLFKKVTKPIKPSQFNVKLLNEFSEKNDDKYLDIKSLNKNILIAEDNPINMILTKKIVKTLFPQVNIIEANNGREAVRFFNHYKPDIVFMDLQMPEMNGYEATTEIRKNIDNSHIPIIALTADVISGTKEMCIESGMNDYITKPVVIEKIKECFINWIKK